MPGNPLTDPNWASDTTETVVRVVDSVRAKTTVPVIKAARALVFGVIAAFLGSFLLVALLVFLMRGIQALLGLGLDHDQAVYVSYLGVGGIFCIVGMLLFRKRHSVAAS